jgi:membrane protein
LPRFFFGHDLVTGQVISSITSLLGETDAQAVQAMLAQASQPREGLIATVMGAGLLVFAAIGVVVQLKDALNTVWEVKEASEGGIWNFRSHLRHFIGRRDCRRTSARSADRSLGLGDIF